jgi:hypothetical protein
MVQSEPIEIDFDKDSLEMRFKLKISSKHIEKKNLKLEHEEYRVPDHDIVGETYFKLRMETWPFVKLVPPANISFDTWECSIMSSQRCNNVKDDLERYLASRVLTWHYERNCHHLDHFDQVMAYRLF